LDLFLPAEIMRTRKRKKRRKQECRKSQNSTDESSW